jgi:hypothetical protein
VAPHDERPDQRLLLTENLTAATIASWKGAFAMVSRDTVERLARQQGLVMALELSDIRRLGDTYFTRVDLYPHGQTCLCGGGSAFAFQRRGGRWVVVGSMSWVS